MKKVLVIDDSSDVLTLMKILLAVHGYEVKATRKLNNALNTILQFKPGIVLLDIDPANDNGKTFCKDLKSHEETKHIPIVLFSSKRDIETSLKDCLAADFILKPFAIEELLSKIKEHYNEPELHINDSTSIT